MTQVSSPQNALNEELWLIKCVVLLEPQLAILVYFDLFRKTLFLCFHWYNVLWNKFVYWGESSMLLREHSLRKLFKPFFGNLVDREVSLVETLFLIRLWLHTLCNEEHNGIARINCSKLSANTLRVEVRVEVAILEKVLNL